MGSVRVLFLIFVFFCSGILAEINLNGETIDIEPSDYNYLINLKNSVNPVKLGTFGHLSRTKTPKYTVIFMHGFVIRSDTFYPLTHKFFVRLVRHLDHYDQSYSNNVQLIAPNWHKEFIPYSEQVPQEMISAFRSGRPDPNQYLIQTVSIIAFINSLLRRGVIHSLEFTGIHGNCLGGIIGIAASLGLRSNLGAVSICSSALFHPDLIRRKILRKSCLKASFLIIQAEGDQLIYPKFSTVTEAVLKEWGAKNVILHKAKGAHFPVMAQHLYTGFRFIASVLCKRPEIFRLEDSYNKKLIEMTKRRVEDIKTIVPIVENEANIKSKL
ncbi:hypothetical protein FG386_003349 [Cryptosporidium ryanae]|uniref:uncharacterized protein n=1 Tax=Cryptosporidium ryanae TaxID=515981 RepID=UPI00351A2F94|nr:hypothetical protein FG386_003349 [Cryptosporidium ryanae]